MEVQCVSTFSTRFAAPALMRLPKQLGHTARALHEKATAWYSRQVLQKRWAKRLGSGTHGPAAAAISLAKR
jgi:hypothetical protein